jgi:protein O-GlcNAc transferase
MFAHKPAPIQVSWLGYPNTTGLQAMDYRFTDRIADPPDRDDAFYSEELVRLKDCFLCYQPHEHSPKVAPLPFVKNDIITFGSFNNAAKINQGVIKAWSKILLGVPDSRLVLKTKQLDTEHVVKRITAMFAEEGIASERIELLAMITDKYDHLALYNEIDVALDPFPYNGTTTTCEALWMGVPVVSLSGDRHSGRVGASILHAIGMQDILVAESIESYIELVVNIAGEKELLIDLRKNLRQQMKSSPLCDAKSFAKKVEDAYQDMWAGLLRKN